MDIQKLIEYIRRNDLFSPGNRLLVALSGGADSVALLRLLIQLGYACEAAHCNFHLRGSESDRDEDFVRQLCHTHNIPLHVAHFDTRNEAAIRHISIEMTARELRYNWFEEIRIACGADAIAVAHHRDDSIETFLLNLMRGTGINGLRGIRPRNGRIVRPLLCLDRHEITSYLESIHQEYVTDSTNLQDEYLRNKIRLNLLPMMQDINPSVKDCILRTAGYLDQAAILYNKSIEEARLRVCIPDGIRIDALLKEPAPETLLFEILHPLGFNASQIADIHNSLHRQSGKIFTSTHWKVAKDRELLLIEAQVPPCPPLLEMTEVTFTPTFIIPRDKHIACFDADKLFSPPTLRLWEQGDTFIPFGMKGRKKVSDYLTDHKFSVFRKQRQWVLCSGPHILWLVGERTDNRFRVDEHTKKILIVTLK